jgi:dinuclear metal center YbgI/SA1388 family protein
VPKLSTLVTKFEQFWPTDHAEDWDNVGLVVGSGDNEIKKILVTVDLTHAVLDEAVALDVELILTHHPVLYKPVTTLAEDGLKGALIARAIRSGISIYSAHTNADAQKDGSSSLLAVAFGLKKLQPLVKTAGGFGHGCLGHLAKPIPLREFALSISEAIPTTARGISVAGDGDRLVQTVAVCGGAGDSFLSDVLVCDADVYVTSDLRHHPALDALETPRAKPLALIDISHFAAESLWVDAAATRLASIRGLEILISNINTDVWNEVILNASAD